MSWSEKVGVLADLLARVEVSDASGATVDADRGFATWVERTERLREAGGACYLIGNGASASMASHFAADLAKNARLHTQVFTDPALVTAVGNDLGFVHVFAEPLRRRARKGDMLVAISSSGRSPNILAAAEAARDLGVTLVTLSAFGDDNPLRKLGDLSFYVRARTYGNAETSHAAILHHWMDALVGD